MKELEVFNFTDDVLEILNGINGELEIASNEIKKFFNNILKENNKKVTINNRVKSGNSLKGKIFRDNYFDMFDEPQEVLDFLSDLIGIRIECRFNKDEDNIYKFLLDYFNMLDENNLSYNMKNPNILLDLNEKQPMIQNNGFEIYKIDGFYKIENGFYNFELQIKSLVNVFWSEIEHEIIYKNNDYVLWDSFFEEILGSIKQNLLMIDQQLKVLDNHFEKISTKDLKSRQLTLEKTLSKMIYTLFSQKMKDSMGFIVNFSKSCDSIVKYLFKSQGADSLQKYQKTFSNTFIRLNEIEENSIDFKNELDIERKPIFTSDFTKAIGTRILEKIHIDFDWSLFFRILFEIEIGNNVEDFENYLEYLKYRFIVIFAFRKVEDKFGDEYRKKITKLVLEKVSHHFLVKDNLEFLYDCNLEKIISIINDLVIIFVQRSKNVKEFKITEEFLIYLINVQIDAVLSKEADSNEMQEIIRFIVQNSESTDTLKDSIDKYIDGSNVI